MRNRLVHYVSKIMGGYLGPGQFVNLLHERVMPRAEVVPWRPTHLSIFVTSRCNLNCDMCPTHSRRIPETYIHRHHKEPDMSPDLLRFVLCHFPDAIRVSLIGVGEPLANPYFFELVQECERRKVLPSTVSNGYELDAHITDILRSALNIFCISVNGHTAKEFNRMTGNPERCYTKILRNMENLLRARGNRKNPRIDLSFIIDKYNYRFLREMIAVGENVGADTVYLAQFQPSPYPGFTPEERCLYADDPAVQEEFIRLMSKKFRCEVKWPYLLRRLENGRTICRWPFNIMQVDGGANVGGCPMLLPNMHENGKVFDNDPWNNQYFRELRRRHLQGDLFWPCKYCVESAGIDPKRLIKRKLSSGVGWKVEKKNIGACPDKRTYGV